MSNLISTCLACFTVLLIHTSVCDSSFISDDIEQVNIDSSFVLIQESIVNAISNHLFEESVSLIQFPSQGNFEWYYKGKDKNYNSATFDYISARLSLGDVPHTLKLSPAGGFANAYSSILKNTYYHIGKHDQKRIDDFRSRNADLTKMIIHNYELQYGSITNEDILEAQESLGVWLIKKIDYIIQYQIAGVWSGTLAVDGAPIAISELGRTKDFSRILPYRKSGSEYILSIVRQYVLNMNQVSHIFSERSQGNWELHDALSHLTHPDSINGGIKLVDPVSLKVDTTYQPAFKIMESNTSIEKSLFTNMVDVQATIEKCHDLGFTVQMIFGRNGERDTITYDEEGVAVDPSLESMMFRMGGITMIDVSPEDYNMDPSHGWFRRDFVKDAIANEHMDNTGYRFALSLGYDLSNAQQGGNVGYIDKLMICSRFEVMKRITKSNIKTYQRKLQSDYLLSDPAMTCQLIKGRKQSDFQVHFVFGSLPMGRAPQMQNESYVLGVKGVFPPDY